MKKIFIPIVAIIILSVSLANSQSTKWKRKSAPVKPELQLFHSIFAINLPTSETLQSGNFYLGIAHRFAVPVSSGIGDLWGIDGSVVNRFDFAYAITNKLLASVGRSNLDGNIDLQLKYKFFTDDNQAVPISATVIGGLAYNGKPAIEPKDDSRLFQYFGQLVINTMFMKKIGFGIVPSYLQNSHIICTDNQYSFTVGLYGQYYVNENLSFIAEANPTVTGWRNKYDSYSAGIELETGGHFFKIIIGNNTAMNPTQFLAGATDAFDSGDLHLGFHITRNL